MIVTEAQSVCILGRQPSLGLAELESLYGPEQLLPFGRRACFLGLDTQDVDFSRLGGSVRLAKILTSFEDSNWTNIEKYLIEKTPEHAGYVEGKLSFGISVFGMNVNPRKLAQTALKIKKAIKDRGKSVRMVPQTELELNAATVLRNKLTGPQGWELLLISDGTHAYLAQTTDIQDIDAYSARDHGRPFRDAKVGMLPPKLAQILVNLAVDKKDNESRITELGATAGDATPKICVLDPFCGTGVVLQEATLMNYDVYGTDLEPRMVQYSIDNLHWLDNKYPELGDYRRIEIGDATKHIWDFSRLKSLGSRLCIAGETYLGQPLTRLPDSEHLAKIMHEVNALHHRFLDNLAKQIPSGTRVCLAIPTWRGHKEFLHLSMLDYLDDLGYNRMKFEHVRNEDLIYHRDGQVVGRELLVLTKR